MVRFFIMCFMAACTFFCGDCSPIRSAVAGRSIVEQSAGQDAPAYIEDGLHFFAEGISPPSYEAQRIQIGNLDTSNGFTVEVYGRPVATQDGCMLSLSKNYNATGFAVCWWIRGERINIRFYNQEFYTGRDNNEISHLSYTCDSDKNFVGYTNGERFIEKNQPYAEIGNPSTYLVGVAGCYCDAYCIRIYNRVLSDEEIQYNYSIDLMRFSL